MMKHLAPRPDANGRALNVGGLDRWRVMGERGPFAKILEAGR